jgi:hypothetical protein
MQIKSISESSAVEGAILGPTRTKWYESMTALAALLAVAGVLSGCGPEYNWREVRPDGQGYAVLLPGKTADMQRSINLDGLTVTMNMHGAQAEGNSFVVATVRLPDAQPQTQRKAIEAMRAGMVRNIAGTEHDVRALDVPVVDAAGHALGHEVATRVEARGQSRGKPMSLIAAFLARGDRAVQAVVVGEHLDRGQANTFVESLRLTQ